MRHLRVADFQGEFEWTPDETLLLARVPDGVEVDAQTGQVLRKYHLSPGPGTGGRFVAVSNDNTRVAVSGGLDDEFELLDRSSGATVGHGKHPQGTVPHLQFSPDSTRLAVSVNNRFNG